MIEIYGGFAALCTPKMLKGAIYQVEEELHIIIPLLSAEKDQYTFENLVLCFLIHNDILRRIRRAENIKKIDKELLFQCLCRYIRFQPDNETIYIELAESSSDEVKEIVVQTADRFKLKITAVE